VADSSDGYKIVSDNRQARHEYEILETYEAGLELMGSEVKSIRQGRVNLRDGYALIKDGELWLHNVHISPHTMTNKAYNHEAKRTRKLLLHRDEIRKLIGKVEQKGLTLVPLKLYLQRGWIKVTIALAKGKKLHDKRETLKRKQEKRETERALSGRG
jgi:SsrA-binding protein